MDAYAKRGGNVFWPSGGSDDLCMSNHEGIMHDASRLVKCQMHHFIEYAYLMNTPADRLKAAREAAGYQTTKEADEAPSAAEVRPDVFDTSKANAIIRADVEHEAPPSHDVGCVQ